MWDFLRKRPLLLSALAASVVSVIAMYSEAALFVLCFLIIILIFAAVYKKIGGRLIFSFLLLFAVTLSAVFLNIRISKVQTLDGTVCEGSFMVADTPIDHGSFHSVTLEAIKTNSLESGERITVSTEDSTLDFAQIIEAEITVQSLEENKYKKGYYADSIYLYGYMKDYRFTNEEDDVLGVVKKVRGYIRDKIFAYYGAEEAATMMALVTGDKSHFTDEFYSNVKGAGVAHVMVVSGMHLSVFVSMFLYLSNKFFYNRFLKALTILAVTVAVATVCGFTMSILRAGITYLLIALALLMNRENTSENTLGGAVTLILFGNPFAIFSVAFQLSVLSTFAILVVAIPVTRYLSERPFMRIKAMSSLAASVLISISTLIFTAPVAIYTFGYVANFSIVTNLLISSATSAAMIICILGFAFPFGEGAFFGVSNLLVSYINRVINYFGSLKNAVTPLPRWTAFIALALIIIILSVLVACKVRKDMLKLKEIKTRKSEEGGEEADGCNF